MFRQAYKSKEIFASEFRHRANHIHFPSPKKVLALKLHRQSNGRKRWPSIARKRRPGELGSELERNRTLGSGNAGSKANEIDWRFEWHPGKRSLGKTMAQIQQQQMEK